jgi:L-ascorbate metabolism protein UlaG (beta-lactamase superfamily)
MKIMKFGQCCLLIEVGGKRILTDPGVFSTTQNDLTDLDLILITHEHGDHLHSESLQTILEKNPQAKVVTNTSVGKVLTEMGVAFDVLEGRATGTHADVSIEAFDGEHVEIIDDFGIVQNTGYFIDNQLFYPGDAYTNPDKAVPVLALSVAGPWCKLSDAIKYARLVKPSKAFPVHDYMLSEAGKKGTYSHCSRELTTAGIEFTELREDESAEF